MAALTAGLRRALASPWTVAAGLVVVLVTQYGGAWSVPFINDDYIFLDKTRAAPFGVVWAARDLLFHYYRPWSRELHYWVLQRLFGPRELPFHLASGALWLAVLALYHAVARRLTHPLAATGATAAVAVLGAWTVPIVWPAGAQDAWMILWALLFLLATMAGRDGWAALAFALALLSKETAVVLPAVALVYHTRVAGRAARAALRRTAWLWAMTLVWAACHPLVGGRWWSHAAPAPDAHVHPPLMTLVVNTLGALVNLYPWPAPESGWGHALRQGLPAAAALAGLVLATAAASPVGRAAKPSPRPGPAPSRPTARASASEPPSAPASSRPSVSGPAPIVFGLGWALLAWLPLGMPTIAWRSHYIVLGALGAWLALAHALCRSRAALVAVVVALALLRPAIGDTVSHDWSTAWYRERAAAFVARMRADLEALRPAFPPHARVFFVRVPSDVGFLAGDGPALRVWYGDHTLSGGFYSAYRPRAAGLPRGDDYFFRFDSLGGWVEVVPGPEDVARVRRANPRWEKDHATLAVTLAEGGDWPRAAAEYAKLAAVVPANADYAHDAALSFETAGDSLAAATWYARAAALPGADDETRRAAARLARYLRGQR